MTANERETVLRRIFEEELIPLLNGYSDDNFQGFGWHAHLETTSHKNLYIERKFNEKAGTVEDTLMDLINLCFIALLSKRGEFVHEEKKK
jgi:hypothetical protein